MVSEDLLGWVDEDGWIHGSMDGWLGEGGVTSPTTVDVIEGDAAMVGSSMRCLCGEVCFLKCDVITPWRCCACMRSSPRKAASAAACPLQCKRISENHGPPASYATTAAQFSCLPAQRSCADSGHPRPPHIGETHRSAGRRRGSPGVCVCSTSGQEREALPLSEWIFSYPSVRRRMLPSTCFARLHHLCATSHRSFLPVALRCGTLFQARVFGALLMTHQGDILGKSGFAECPDGVPTPAPSSKVRLRAHCVSESPQALGLQ